MLIFVQSYFYILSIMLLDYNTTRIGTSRVAKTWDEVCVDEANLGCRKLFIAKLGTTIEPGDFVRVSVSENNTA